MPSTRVLRVIADRLGTPLDYLLEGDATLERELVLEQARLAIARGRPRAALALLGPLHALPDAPLGSEARFVEAQALLELGRVAEAHSLLDAEERILRARQDEFRLRRVRDLRARRRPAVTAAAQLRLAKEAMRAGEREVALQHYRAARILLEAGRFSEGGRQAT